jgi:hypothetical protein
MRRTNGVKIDTARRDGAFLTAASTAGSIDSIGQSHQRGTAMLRSERVWIYFVREEDEELDQVVIFAAQDATYDVGTRILKFQTIADPAPPGIEIGSHCLMRQAPSLEAPAFPCELRNITGPEGNFTYVFLLNEDLPLPRPEAIPKPTQPTEVKVTWLDSSDPFAKRIREEIGNEQKLRELFGPAMEEIQFAIDAQDPEMVQRIFERFAQKGLELKIRPSDIEDFMRRVSEESQARETQEAEKAKQEETKVEEEPGGDENGSEDTDEGSEGDEHGGEETDEGSEGTETGEAIDEGPEIDNGEGTEVVETTESGGVDGGNGGGGDFHPPAPPHVLTSEGEGQEREDEELEEEFD